MSASVHAQDLLREIAEPARPGEGVKAMLRRVMMATGLPYGRVRGLYHGAVRVSGDELLHLQKVRDTRKAAKSAKAEGEYHDERAELRTRLAEQAERLDRIERLLASIAASDRPVL